MSEDKKSKPKAPKNLSDLLTFLQKEHGATSVGRLADLKEAIVPVIPSGSLSLDRAMGCGGYPRGRIIEIFGPESSGKTTLTLEAMARVQADMEQVAFIDAEHAIDLDYARRVGVDVDSMIFSQPDSGEQALEIAEKLAESGEVALIVIDSVAALVPKAELEGEMGQSHVGLHARLMSQACRKLVGVCKRTNTTVIFINQLRMKIGVLYGSPETTTGGQALKFYASIRLDVRRRAQVKDASGDAFGNTTEVKVVKNKMAPPFREASFEIRWGHGIDKEGDILNVGVELGVVEKSGAWLSYNGERLGQGFNNAGEFLRKNPKISAEVDAKVRQKMRAE